MDNLLPGCPLGSALATTEDRRLKALVADSLYIGNYKSKNPIEILFMLNLKYNNKKSEI